MRRTVSPHAPLGRLHTPLLQLAERVHAALTRKNRTVWVDDRGTVFLHDADLVQSMSPRSIVGTYDADTPLRYIEADLRLALRQRASAWITDWKEQPAPVPYHVDRLQATTRARRRSRRDAHKQASPASGPAESD